MRAFRLALIITLFAVLVQAQGWPPRNGSTLPSTCSEGESFWKTTSTTTELHVCTATDTWTAVDGATAGGDPIPSGAIIPFDGSCPAAYTEFGAGKFLLGTTTAAGDVGTEGGADSISGVINHTHTVTVTDPQHTHVQQGHTHTLPVGATDDTAAPFDRADAGTNASGANATTASGSATAVNNNAATGVTASTANPAGGVASVDNRPAFRRVIYCKKT